jgi:hypothetical protein
MSIKVLPVGRLGIVLEDAKGELQMPDSELFAATHIAQVKAIFQDHSIQHVFMGAGLELEQGLEIVRTAFKTARSLRCTERLRIRTARLFPLRASNTQRSWVLGSNGAVMERVP